MTENKRYTVIHLGNPVDCVIKDHTSDNTIGIFSSMHNPVNEVCDLLNGQEERIIDLKNTIIKITIAYQRKHDNTIVNLVDEIWEEDIGDLFIELNQDGGIRND